MRSGDAYHAKPADMWALGITLYCFVFGDLPFKVCGRLGLVGEGVVDWEVWWSGRAALSGV